jgi:hypothetical protein
MANQRQIPVIQHPDGNVTQLQQNTNKVLRNLSNQIDTLNNTSTSLNSQLSGIPVKSYLKDIKPSGTNGGAFTSGSWLTRTLNTNENLESWISLSANQFTLQPGTYEIYVTAPASGVDQHKAKLRNITDSSDVIIGSSEDARFSDNAQSSSIIDGKFKITKPIIFEIQHQCITTQVSVIGFGQASGFGVNEVYTQVEITKVSG